MQTLLFALRRKAQKPVLALVLAAMALTSGPVSSEAFFWDPDASTSGNDADGSGLGGSGTWDTTTGQWWDLSSLIGWPNTGTDPAIFTYAYPGLGIPVQNTVTVDAGGVNAGRISFLRSGYTLSGGAITLASSTPTLHAALGDSATILSNLLGTAGLTKTGGGSIRLSGDNSGLTGPLSIANGTLVISNPLALPGTGAVSILTNNETPLNTNLLGFTGGSLVLDGLVTGFTFARDVDFEGRGPIGDRGSAILSLGENTLSGTVTTAVSPLPLSPTATFRNSRITSVNGTLTLSGTLNAGGTSATTFVSLGGVNSAGVGNFNLSGVLSGTGSIEKSGAGTLFLNPSSTSGFAGTVRISGSAAGQQSSVRVTQASVGGTSIFGANTGTTTAAAIDLNGAGLAVLEFRNDGDLNFGALASGKNVYNRNGGIIFTGPAAGGAAINGTTTLGALQHVVSTTASAATTTFNSRNGFGVTFSTMVIDNSTSGSTLTNTLTNNMGGNLTFTGNVTIGDGNTASRPRVLAIGGGGNTYIQGSVIAGTDTGKTLTKSGAGNLTIQGVGTTVAGTISITAGAITVTDFRSLNNNTAAISLGATTTVGNLIIGGVGTPTLAGLTTSKTITLNTTTVSPSIYANQSGSNPVVLNGAITRTTQTTGGLILGGSNTADNIINVAIPVGGTTGGLTKLGAGTWVLNAANAYPGATTIQNGTLKLRATAAASDVIPSAATNTVVFSADTVTQSAGGTLEFRGFLDASTTETLGALTPTAGAAKIVTVANGSGTAALTFSSLGTRGAGAYVDYRPGASTTLSFTTLPTVTNGILGAASASAFQTFNGVDWATLSGSNVVPFASYTVDALPASGVAGAAVNYSQSVNAATTGTASINTLKLIGGGANPTVTLGGVLTLTGRAILFDNTSGTGTITGSQLGANATEVHVITNGASAANGGVSGVALTLGNALTINSLIGGTTGSFTKSGTGTSIVGGNNTFTGNATINEGIVQLSGSTATLGVNSTVGNLTTVRQGATLDINAAGASQTINLGALVGSGVITNSGGGVGTAGTISFGRSTSTGPTVFSGVLQDGPGAGGGVLNVMVDGTTARTQAFIGNNTYTGVTTIATGAQLTVDVLANGGPGNASGIGSSTSVAGNLVFNGAAPQLIYRGNILNGSLNLGSASATTDRLFTIAGAGAILSSTVSNNNAIVWSNTGAIVHGTDANRTLTLTGTSTGDNTFNPQLTDSSGFVTSLSKTAAGQWNLGNSSNAYTGTTSVADGILALNDNGALPANSPLVLGATTTTGIIQMSGIFARNLAATATPGTGTITWGGTTGGGGFAAHATPLTVTLNSGAGLTWGSGGFVGSGGGQALIFNSTTALSNVTFTNAIDLAGVPRTVTVNDNTNTGADYATLSGVISGAAESSLTKTGNGILRLGEANTYEGNTQVSAGTLSVSRLGDSTTPGASSVGDSTAGNTNAGAILLGNGTTTGGILQYTGAGEISDRKIRLNTTTGGNQIHADGAGALILTNVVNDLGLGAKTLSLRGSNTAGNMITSLFSDNGGALSIGVDGGATWILTNGSNSYTGTTTVGGGALGIGHNTAIGGALTISNGNVFAYGADRTLTNTLNLGNNATSGFIGDYNLTFNGTNNLAASANNLNFYNSVAPGKAVTFNGLLANALTANRTWLLDGPGETVVNGAFTTSTDFGVAILKSGNGTLTLGTNGATSNWNQAGAIIDLDRGTLRFAANEAIPSTASTNGGLTISPEVATTDAATVDLNGTTQTVNALTATSNGVLVLDNTAAAPATFRFGANDSVVNFGSGLGSYSILNSGVGALSIVKLGNTTTTFGTGITLGHAGITASEGGGVFNLASPVTATSGLRVSGSSRLSLTGGLTNPSLITSIEVGGGSTLSLLDGAGSVVNNLTSLHLGAGSGTATLNLNVGDSSTDSFTLLTGGVLSLANSVTFNLTDSGLSPLTTYTLLNLVDGGITGFGPANMIQGTTPGGFSGFTWNVTDNLVQITTGTLVTGSLYWRGIAGGGTDTTWNANANNWALDKGNATASTTTPGQGTDVIFAIDSTTGDVVTTLEQNFKINSLTLEGGTTTPTSVTIAPGGSATNRLEVAPQLATDGVRIPAGGPAAVTISAPFRLGADQTWTVADAASTLTFSGGLFGERDVIKGGLGRVLLSASADPAFNAGGTATFTVTGGNLEFTNSAAFGTTANSNVADIVVSGGGFYYNNAVAGTALTLPHNITLSGGAVSGGGANHVYGGTVNVSSASTINLADSNGPVTNTARNITLSGVVSGAGNLTINGNNTVAAGNQISGNLTMNNAANSWSGDLLFNRGTVTIGALASPGFAGNDVTFDAFGKLALQGVNSQTLTRTGTLSFAANAVGEFSVDNTSGTLGANFLVEQDGAVSIGSGGTGATVRLFLADVASAIDIGGAVTLGGNTSISVAGGDADSFATISGIIGDDGSGYGLTVNDDAGAWAQTNTILRLTGANTFAGNVTIDSGVLEFDTVTNISGGPSSLGNGAALSLVTGNLRFIGGANQSTNRPIATTGSATLSANGTPGAVITYNGAITQIANNTLTLAGTGEGVITGGITQPAGAASADLTVAGGTWTIRDNNVSIADDLLVNAGTLTLRDMVFTLNDDVVVTGGSAVLNLDTTGVLIANNIAGTSSGLHARTGGVINLNANDIFGTANSGGLDFINVGDSGVGAAGVFNTNGFNITSPGLLVGGVADGLEGNVTGSGTITVTSAATDHSLGIRVYRGAISANLAGVASLLKQGLGTMTLSGDNSGLTGTVAATRLDAGSLVLDFAAQNNNKISAVAALDMRGATLTLNGNNSAASSQTVASFTLANGGANSIILNKGSGGNDVALNLGAITRAVNSQDGTLRIVLPSGVQSATNGVTTSTGVTGGILGTAAFATVEDGTGTWFATKAGSNIVALASTPKNDVSTWLVGDHITDETTGFTGTYSNVAINSLRFNAVGGSNLNLGARGALGIATGGILVTGSVGGSPVITGGTLFSGAAAATPELIVTQDSASPFEINSDIRVNHILIKSGTGALLLSGNNVYTGATEIQNGTLQLRGGNAVGDNSAVTLSDDEVTTLELLDDETMGRLGGGSTTDGLRNLATVNVGGFTLTTNITGGNTTYSGKFIGNGTIVKNGFGTNTNWNLNNISDGFTGTVIVNGGLLQLSNIGRIDATAFVFNKNGSLLLDNNSTTSSGARILDTASITMNSADGAASGETRPSGIWIRRDQGSTQNETVGVLSINSGASYTRLEGNATNAVSTIIADNIIRANSATLNVRGTNMTATTGQRGQLRIGTAGNQTTFMSANMVGGGGALGSKTISIIPWAIAEETAAAVGDANMGNSLASYVSGVGFRALNLTTEYDTYAAAVAQSNTRESLAADLTGLNGKTINSLVLHNSSVTPATTYNVTGSGADQTLALTSGALLFTLNPVAGAGAYGINLGGFDSGITVGGTNEFVIHVVNPSSAIASVLTATISSNLTSTANITKSGRGTLILTGTNTAGGGSVKTTINEGVLEIADLDNIGGGTGGLVFAGGTLRLSGAYTGDDLSSRTISFLQGGGTLDTNGIDLALANSLGSGVGGFTKTGAGNLTLNAVATYTGNSVLSLGTFTVGANNALGNGGNLTLVAGTTLAFSGTNTLNHGLVTTSGASPQITGTGTINASTGFFFNHTGDMAISAVLGGNGGLLKAQANILTLGGLNTYTGTTEIQAGTLSIDSIGNVSGGASALGNPGNAEDGIIRMGLTTAATTLNYTGSGHTSNRLIGMQGTTGGVTLNGNGTGAVGYGGARFEMAGSKTLTLRGSSDVSLINTIGAIQEIGGVLTLNKTDANTWQVNQASSYTGVTQIDNGTLMIGVDDALPTGTTVRLGTGATEGTFDLNGFSQTIASLLVQTNSTTLANTLIVDTGETLTVNGAVAIGANVAASTTLFNATGGGSFVNNNDGGTFQIGGATGATNANSTTADFSGLASFTANLGAAGTFRVGDANTGTAAGPSTLILATGSMINAGTLRIGDGSGAGSLHTLVLGSGTNLINANTVNIGSAGAAIRSSGRMIFDPSDTAGTVTVRAFDGTSRAVINMVNTTGNTATDISSVIDLTDHTADILASTLVMANRTLSANAASATLSFNQGSLDVTTVNMASRTGTGTGNATATVNLGDSAAPGTPTVFIGAINMAVNTSAGGTVSADLNISGGDVSIGTGSGTAINMANAAASRTATSNINLTGGTVDVTGNIIRQGGAGTENATVTLNGSTLDMNGNNIGTGAAAITLNARSGTLRNLGELNGGGTLDKTTAGTLILDTSNSYTGATTVSAGVLQVSNGGALGGTAAGTTVADGAALELSGNITTTNEALTLNGSGVSDGGALRNTSGNNTYAGNITLATASRIDSDAGLLTLDAITGAAIVATDQNLTLSGSGNITVADAINLGTGNLVKDGAGTVILSGDNSYTGTTTVSDGLLRINGDSSLATGAVSVASGATLGGSGTIGGLSSTTTIASGGTLTGGNVGSSGTVGVLDPLVTDAVGTLTFGGDLTASSGSIWLVDLVQGGTADLINVGGALDITGANLAINFGGGFVVDQVYTIANYTGGLTGSFAGFIEGAFVDPNSLYRINYGTGPSGAITLTAVPEPGTLGFLGLALGGFFVRRIRRRRAAAAALAQERE